MIPTVEEYSMKYIRLVNFVVTIISALLCFSLVRNTTDISLAEMLIGLTTIIVVITYTLIRDQRSYWVYTLCAIKAYMNKETMLAYASLGDNKKAMACYRSPLYMSIIGLLIINVISVICYWLFLPYIDVYLMFAGLMLIPTLVNRMVGYAIKYHLYHTIMFLSYSPDHDFKAKKTLPKLVWNDLILFVMVNLALVLPIISQPNFSLSRGYGTIEFSLAFAILLVIICFFTLTSSMAVRKFSFIGELLTKEISPNALNAVPVVDNFNGSKWRRYAYYHLATFIWGVVICQVFELAVSYISFSAIYIVGFLPLVVMYYIERYKTLYDNLKDACEVKDYLDNRVGMTMDALKTLGISHIQPE